jgi:hypothetical protein
VYDDHTGHRRLEAYDSKAMLPNLPCMYCVVDSEQRTTEEVAGKLYPSCIAGSYTRLACNHQWQCNDCDLGNDFPHQPGGNR